MFGRVTINHMKKLRNDCLVIIVVLLAAMLLFGIQHSDGEGSRSVAVYQYGELTDTFLLTDLGTITIHDPEGGYNILSVSKEGVSMQEADCPDRLCVKHRRISKGGESIICLPHQLVIEIVTEEPAELDAITN